MNSESITYFERVVAISSTLKSKSSLQSALQVERLIPLAQAALKDNQGEVALQYLNKVFAICTADVGEVSDVCIRWKLLKGEALALTGKLEEAGLIARYLFFDFFTSIAKFGAIELTI
jgi:DnaJ family protein C protein 7